MADRTNYPSVEDPVSLQFRTIWRSIKNFFPTISASHVFSCSSWHGHSDSSKNARPLLLLARNGPIVGFKQAFYCGLDSGPNGHGSSKLCSSELYVAGPSFNQLLSAFEVLASGSLANSAFSAGVLQR